MRQIKFLIAVFVVLPLFIALLGLLGLPLYLVFGSGPVSLLGFLVIASGAVLARMLIPFFEPILEFLVNGESRKDTNSPTSAKQRQFKTKRKSSQDVSLPAPTGDLFGDDPYRIQDRERAELLRMAARGLLGKSALSEVPDKYKSDMKMVLTLMDTSPHHVDLAIGTSLVSDKKFIYECWSRIAYKKIHSWMVENLECESPPTFREAFMQTLKSKNRRFFYYHPLLFHNHPEFHDDEEIVSLALEQDVRNIRFVSHRLRDEEGIINKEKVLKALRLRSKRMLLKDDEKIFRGFQFPDQYYGYLVVPDRFRDDKDIILAVEEAKKFVREKPEMYHGRNNYFGTKVY